MNVQLQGGSLFAGNNSIFGGNVLKSTQEKLQRQTERDNQVAFLESQKSNLKNMECDSLDEISRKLDLFHAYEEQIAAVNEAYNNSQMFHVMDEAIERGEQIAEAAENYEPKTAEERREKMVEEALGTDENKGGLTENMEELSEPAEEITEEMADSNLEDFSVSSDAENISELERIYQRFDIRI